MMKNHCYGIGEEIHYPCAFVCGSYDGETKLGGIGFILKKSENDEGTTINGRCDGNAELHALKTIYTEMMSALIAVQRAIKFQLPEIHIYSNLYQVGEWPVNGLNTSIQFLHYYMDQMKDCSNRINIHFYKIPDNDLSDLKRKAFECAYACIANPVKGDQ